MWLAIEAEKRDEADAMVSAGNTGALMAMAKFLLRTLPGIDRRCGRFECRDQHRRLPPRLWVKVDVAARHRQAVSLAHDLAADDANRHRLLCAAGKDMAAVAGLS